MSQFKSTLTANKPSLVARSRAVGDDDKRERYHAILDAAERLLVTEPDRVSIMADVAMAAGVAKGTVYLYFPSKEALLLALHDRHTERFFNALHTLLNAKSALTYAKIQRIAQTHITEHPAFMPCAAVCFGADRTMPAEPMHAHMSRVASWLDAAAHGLHQKLPHLSHAQAIALLRRSYALMLGMWILLKPESRARLANDAAIARVCFAEYATETHQALQEMWKPFFSPTSSPRTSSEK